MAALTIQSLTATGTTPTYGAVASEDTITVAGSGLLLLHVKNGGGGADTVTIVDAGSTPAGNSASNPTVSVPSSTGDKIIVLSPKLADSDGVITIQHSATSSVTCAVFRA